MLDIVNQAHDKIFKETYGSIEVAREFFENKLPKEVLKLVNLDTLETQKDSYINKELKEFFSDLLFKVDINNKEGYFYLLIEHKSYKEKLAIFQMLRYILEIWESKFIKEEKETIPVIIPFLVYHDKSEWNIKQSISEMIYGYGDLPQAIKEYIPNYKYILHDLTKYRKEEIRVASLQGVIDKLLANARYTTQERLIEVVSEGLEVLYNMYEKDKTIYYFETCLKYILSIREDLEKEDTIKAIEKISKEGSEIIMTLAEQWIEEGIEKGIEKGMAEGMKTIAKNMILENEPIDKIMKYTKLTKEELENIRKEIN